MNRTALNCPVCGVPLAGSETQCPNCMTPLAPVAKKVRPKMDPQKKRLILIILGAVLAVALIVGFCLIWYWRMWFFEPKMDLSAFPSDITFVDESTEPSEEQMKAIADYVEALRVQSYHRLSFSERDGSKKVETVVDCISGSDPDIGQMLKDIGADIKTATATADQRFTLMTSKTDTPLITADASVEVEIGSYPATAFHSSTQVRLASKNAESRTCRYCGRVNPPTAEKCENCGSLLITEQTVFVDDLNPSVSAAGDGLTEAQRTAYMLNNVSGTLLLANRPTLALFLTCLACAKDPSNVSALASLVTQLRMRDALPEALAICNVGLSMDPTREELFVHAGNICVQLDRPDDALKYYSRCLEANTFSGPMSQAAMFAYLQKKDYVNAFRCMLDGAKDGYTSEIRVAYDLLRMRGDYWEFAGAVFENYSVRSLMDFTMNRSGFNPANELTGKVADIGAVKVPSSPADWLASAETIIKQGRAYLNGALTFYKEDIQLIADVYDILLNSNDLKDLAKGFISKFGDKLKKEELTESERIVSYEQAEFWLDILDDFQEWKVKDIREKMDKELESSDFDLFYKKMFDYMEQSQTYLESLDLESIPGMVAAFEWMFARVDNNSVAFTAEETATLVPKAESALRQNGTVRNKAYQEIAEVEHDYFMFANTILGMVGDKELYQKYRQEITLDVVTAQSVCIAENVLSAYMVPVIAEPYLMLGTQAQEGITSGAITGKCPTFPKFIISDKPPRPSPDMYADIVIPDISAITADVLGIDLYGQPNTANRDYPALVKIWENYWKETHPGVDASEMPAPPNFGDSMERERFWNGLTPEQRVRYSAMAADPDVVKRTVVLDVFCAKGQGAVSFTKEKVGWLSGLSSTVSVPGYGVTMGADGTYSGKAKLGIGDLSVDNKGNVSFTVNDKASGLEFGVKKTGRDVTTYLGTDFGLKPKYTGIGENGKPSGGSASIGGVGASVNGQIYGTYSFAKGQWTSGGMLVGARAVLGGIIGVGTTSNVNLVQGISTSEIYMVFAGEKLGVRFKEDYNYEDRRETNDVPGIQEFHR